MDDDYKKPTRTMMTMTMMDDDILPTHLRRSPSSTGADYASLFSLGFHLGNPTCFLVGSLANDGSRQDLPVASGTSRFSRLRRRYPEATTAMDNAVYSMCSAPLVS